MFPYGRLNVLAEAACPFQSYTRQSMFRVFVLFVLFVCAYFLMSSGQNVSLRAQSAAQTDINSAQAAGAAVLADTGFADDADLHGADPLLAEVPPEVPELSGTAVLTLPADTTAAVYDVRDLAGPRRLFFDGPLHPPRLSSVLL